MTFHDVYIGWADDPEFSLEGGDSQGNVPYRQSPFFPSGGDPFWKLVRGIDAGTYRGRQVDWGGWASPMTVSELRTFIAECYPPRPTKDQDPRVTEVIRFVEALDPEKEYILVAAEL